MKRIFVSIMAMAVLTGVALVSSAGKEEAPRNSRQEKSLEERLKNVGKQLDELQSSISKKSRAVEKQVNRSLQDAKKKNRDVSQQLEQSLEESIRAWRVFIVDVSKEINNIEEAFRKAVSSSPEESIK